MQEFKVLIVDDSLTMRQLISFTLKRLSGIQISEAGDGVEGLKKITSEQFDLVFTDINMPVMDGLKLVSLVRGDLGNHDLPIVIITTEGAQEDRDRALGLGANDYITKPIQPNRILDVTRKILNIP